MVFITVHPGQVSPAVLSLVDTVIAVGPSPEATLGQFCEAVGEHPPAVPDLPLQPEEVLVWRCRNGDVPFPLRAAPSRGERRRHTRKYAEGELPPDRSFYFRGPEGK